MIGNRKLNMWYLCCTLVIISSVPGCFFEPREAELPAAGNTVTYFAKTSSNNVWANLGKSLEATNSPGWEDNISLEEFVYIPDTDTENQFPPGTFVGWDRDREVSFINGFYNSDVSIVVQMKNDEFVVPGDTGTEVEWENVIYFLTVTNNADNSVIKYRGSAIITFKLEGNFWYVSQWRDQQGESDPDSGQPLPTMGVLRGNFASI
ncbi:MAG: hypothetical protein ACI9UQ_001723 [Candidatus Krumholzibacteriia bacterium]|jgi:hypothetical protein